MEVGFDFLVSDDSTKIFTEIFNFEEPDTNNVQMFRVPLFEETSGDNFKQFELNVLQDELSFFISDSVFTLPRIHLCSTGANAWTGGLTLQVELIIEVNISDALVSDEEE